MTRSWWNWSGQDQNFSHFVAFLNAQTTQSLDLIRHGTLSIKVMLRLYATDIWVLVKSNSVARVETRSSLVGLCGSGWAQIQQSAPHMGQRVPLVALTNVNIIQWFCSLHVSLLAYSSQCKRHIPLLHFFKWDDYIDLNEVFPKRTHYAPISVENVFMPSSDMWPQTTE